MVADTEFSEPFRDMGIQNKFLDFKVIKTMMYRTQPLSECLDTIGSAEARHARRMYSHLVSEEKLKGPELKLIALRPCTGEVRKLLFTRALETYSDMDILEPGQFLRIGLILSYKYSVGLKDKKVVFWNGMEYSDKVCFAQCRLITAYPELIKTFALCYGNKPSCDFFGAREGSALLRLSCDVP